jgi:hypothetical protein
MLGKARSFSDVELKAQFLEFARATPEDMKKQIFKLTEWWNGYQSSVKAIVKTESQGFEGTLNVTCIKGGAITQLEAAEMARIMEDAKNDCSMSGITVRYHITKMSYCDFLAKYEQAREVTDYASAVIEEGVPKSREPAIRVPSGNPPVGDEKADARVRRSKLQSEVAALRAELAAKENELTAITSAKDRELAA